MVNVMETRKHPIPYVGILTGAVYGVVFSWVLAALGMTGGLATPLMGALFGAAKGLSGSFGHE